MTILTGPVFKPKGNIRSLVVLLHGIGADGQDLIDFASSWSPSLPETEFFAPHAPFPFDMAAIGRQWFSLNTMDISALQAGIRTAREYVHHTLNHALEQRSLTEDKVALVGFSQGAMVALYSALRRPRSCAAVVSFSGALIEDHTCYPQKSTPPIFLSHGDQDSVVPFEALSVAENLLKQQGLSVTTLPRPGYGHGIDPVAAEHARAFLTYHLQKKP